MTEQEWLECADPGPMLKFLRAKVSDRKLRLFAVACCRRIWHLMHLKESRQAVDLAEKFADGRTSVHELELAAGQADTDEPPNVTAQWAAFNAARCEGRYLDADSTAHFAAEAMENAGGGEQALHVEMAQQSRLVRCIFGMLPFRSATAPASWLTPTVLSLATAIYDDRVYDRLPILADALEDAGCTDANILNHCRQPGEHVLGCWALDLILGKS